jgi:hypothetical protein
MNFWKKIITLLSIMILSHLSSFSQESFYVETAFSGCFSTFRDMATSPLYYTGQILGFTGGWHGLSEKRERSVQVSYNSGAHTSHYNNTTSNSSFTGIDILVQHLYSVSKQNLLAVQIGGTILSTTNMRNNQALMNNSFGLENVSNLMFSGKLTANISRKKTRILDFALFQIKIQPSVRTIALTLNTGVLNLNYRPGYAYNYLPEINGLKMNNLKDYKLSLNGYRINALLSFSKQLKNKNILRASYLYDLYKAPGKYEPFNSGRHSIRFSLLFNYK